MRYISLFAGIGGFDLALNRLGHICVWANEWDKYAAQIYTKNFEQGEGIQQRIHNGSSSSIRKPHMGSQSLIDTRDIRTVTTKEIPDHDLLVGGFPCQAFSIAGKRRGFSETRGTLFFEIARILKDKQPKFFILENVKGLLSHDNGDTFKIIVTTLTELGYDLQWQVLNSKNFGVPQNRERVFIVGNIRGESRPEIFPIRKSNKAYFQKDAKAQSKGKRIRGSNISAAIDANYYKGAGSTRQMIEVTAGVSDAQRIYDSKGIAKTLKGLGGGLGAKTGLYAVPMRWVRTEKGKEYRKNAKKLFGKDLTPFNEGYRELVESKEAVTGCLTNALQKDALLKHNMEIRRLTPVECERLQGFPDGWTAYGKQQTPEGYKCEKCNGKNIVVHGLYCEHNPVLISDTQRYKCLGNAVTVNVVYEVAKRLERNKK